MSQRFAFDDPRNLPVEVIGATDFDARPGGLSPRRLPGWTRPQVPQFMDVMVRMPAGVRLRFHTDSPFVELQVQTTRMATEPSTPRLVAFDLAVAGGEVQTQAHDAGNTIWLDPTGGDAWRNERSDPYQVRFEGLERTGADYELWLPANAFVEVHALVIADDATLQAAAADERPVWLHYGSSISHCMEAEHPRGTWPAVAAAAAGVSLRGFGFGGNCHLDPFVAKTIRDTPADCISLKVGINIVNMDSMRERVFLPLLHGFLDTVREQHRETPLLLVSPIYCPSAETVPGPTAPGADGRFRTIPGHDEIRTGCLTLERMRKLMAELVEQRRAAGDHHLHYLSGLELFGEADAGDLPDDLHPNPAGYARMGQRFAEHAFASGLLEGVQ